MVDFGENKDGTEWIIINDGVMGGRSQSSALLNEENLVFSGVISLKNNGGFASLRSPIAEYDLSKYKKLKMRFKSSGRDFSIMLERYRAFYNPVYKHDFKSIDNKWQEIEISLSDFKEYRLDQLTGKSANAEGLSKTFRFGIILFDKKEGPFNLELDYIEFI
jgi:hypothetical protein